jgi:hypothetical protein
MLLAIILIVLGAIMVLPLIVFDVIFSLGLWQ